MQEQTFQVGIKALIRSLDGDILLIKDTNESVALYDLPGGRMQPGEDFEQALTRELGEEIGYAERFSAHPFATVLSKTTIHSDSSDLGLILVVFTVSLNSYDKLVAAEPTTALEWHSPNSAAQLLANKYPDDFCKQIKELA